MAWRRRAWWIVLVTLFLPAPVLADRVTLANGTVLEGDSIPVNSMVDLAQRAGKGGDRPNADRLLLVDQVYRRYLVPLRQVREDVDEQQLITYDRFELPQRKSPAKLNLASVALPMSVTPFDERGVRTVTFAAPGNRAIELIQGVTEINPRYLVVEGVNQQWWQGIGTEMLPPETLSRLLRSAIDAENPDQRLAVARLLIQAGRYEMAAEEMAAIQRDFPELQERVAALDRELVQLRAGWLLSELRKRRVAGQHRLAMNIARAFPTDVDFSAEILSQVDELRGEYRTSQERADLLMLHLGELEAELENEKERGVVAEMRRTVGEQLDWESLPRFEAFLTLANDASLPAGDRLALAYSGWMLGNAKAITDFPQTLQLWDARWHLVEYLRSNDAGRRAELLASLSSMESIGPQQVADLIPFLPPLIETAPSESAGAVVLETQEIVPGWGEEANDPNAALSNVAGPVRYAVSLPPEYSPTRTYPLLVALRAGEWNIQQAAEFWGVRRKSETEVDAGPATQAGYIVIAPEFAARDQFAYQFSAHEHLAILAAIRDAKRRFMIDSDRVFLTGHGMGGDAAFDLAFSQPHLFAGAIPISGIFGRQILFEKQSVPRVPMYVVNGELDRAARATQGEHLAHLMYRGHDIIYCEYVGRGYEHYADEIPRLLEWMGRFRRIPDPKVITEQIARTSDTSAYWISAERIPPRNLVGRATAGGVVANPLSLEARILEGNSVAISSPGERHVLRLNGTMVNLEERVKVRLGSRQRFHDFLEPQIEPLLTNFEESADRQRLYPIRLTVE